MKTTRTVKEFFSAQPVLEGAGVHLKRSFGHMEAPKLDPFLLFDDFHSDDPAKYLKGFPWHPHRGIETITYVIHGEVEHGDSMGNRGVINAGDVQWMTAGSGIVHQEMPKGDEKNVLWGFQLWANLPASHKMMAPRYREIKKEQIPEVSGKNGIKIKVICGSIENIDGPVQDIVTEPQYLDITIPEEQTFEHSIPEGHTVFAYIIRGSGAFAPDGPYITGPETLVVFNDGESVKISAAKEALRFLLISGKPIKEPVAWRGPIVMNTQEELETAFEEYRNNTFLKHTSAE